jgi:hypothetical protein
VLSISFPSVASRRILHQEIDRGPEHLQLYSQIVNPLSPDFVVRPIRSAQSFTFATFECPHLQIRQSENFVPNFVEAVRHRARPVINQSLPISALSAGPDLRADSVRRLSAFIMKYHPLDCQKFLTHAVKNSN